MPSWLRTCFTLAAVLLVMALVLLAVAGVIDRHLKEHGHDGTTPLLDVEQAHGAEAKPRRKAEQGGGGHASFFATARLSDAVRRRRNGSDTP